MIGSCWVLLPTGGRCPLTGTLLCSSRVEHATPEGHPNAQEEEDMFTPLIRRVECEVKEGGFRRLPMANGCYYITEKV